MPLDPLNDINRCQTSDLLGDDCCPRKGPPESRTADPEKLDLVCLSVCTRFTREPGLGDICTGFIPICKSLIFQESKTGSANLSFNPCENFTNGSNVFDIFSGFVHSKSACFLELVYLGFLGLLRITRVYL